MPWVVDTCILIDILEDDPEFAEGSARCLDEHAVEGLVVCPMTYAELAPAFGGDLLLQDEFLAGLGVSARQDWTWQDTLRAHEAWQAHTQRRRSGRAGKRPLADILIGAFALRFKGLVTRNASDFRSSFPQLELRVPGAASGPGQGP